MPAFSLTSLLWGLLSISAGSTFAAALLGSWRIALLAAGCSLAFAIAALPSIGVFILLLTGFQLLLAYVLYHRRQSPTAR